MYYETETRYCARKKYKFKETHEFFINACYVVKY